MKTLQIDDKWSVEYDPENNDRPGRVLRYGEPSPAGFSGWTNDVVAMFYALLEAKARVAELECERRGIRAALIKEPSHD